MSKLTEEQVKEFKKQVEGAEDSHDYRILAEEVFNAGDKGWARKLFKKSEDKAEDFTDYIDLADSIYDTADREWGIELYKKAEELALNFKHYQHLGESYCLYPEDSNYARKMYLKSLELAGQYNGKQDFEELAFSITSIYHLGDEEWAEEIRKKGADFK